MLRKQLRWKKRAPLSALLTVPEVMCDEERVLWVLQVLATRLKVPLAG